MHVSTYSFENSSNHYRNAAKGNTKALPLQFDMIFSQTRNTPSSSWVNFNKPRNSSSCRSSH